MKITVTWKHFTNSLNRIDVKKKTYKILKRLGILQFYMIVDLFVLSLNDCVLAFIKGFYKRMSAMVVYVVVDVKDTV